MSHGALTPVFVGLRTGLHLLFVALTALVTASAILAPTDASAAVIALTVVLLATYSLGGLLPSAPVTRQRVATPLWLALITVEWIVLVWMISEAAYLAFPLFFLHLHLLGRRVGSVAVAATTLVAILALGFHDRWSVGGVVGPLVGACVAMLIGMGYQSLAREAVERERLMEELIATRDRLAVTEHESGVLAERGRLAREIHDTIAQGLSSIQMLLHAAERADPDRPGIEHIRLARETAADSLADTRWFIRELTPPGLEDEGLGAALRRLAETQWEPGGVAVNIRVTDPSGLPMHLQTALLRIAQGALANVIQHADATTATVTLTADQDAVRFSIADDGSGFDPNGQPPSGSIGRRTDSFGLQATRERVDQLNGVLTVDSRPGKGTTIVVDLDLENP